MAVKTEKEPKAEEPSKKIHKKKLLGQDSKLNRAQLKKRLHELSHVPKRLRRSDKRKLKEIKKKEKARQYRRAIQKPTKPKKVKAGTARRAKARKMQLLYRKQQHLKEKLKADKLDKKCLKKFSIHDFRLRGGVFPQTGVLVKYLGDYQLHPKPVQCIRRCRPFFVNKVKKDRQNLMRKLFIMSKQQRIPKFIRRRKHPLAKLRKIREFSEFMRYVVGGKACKRTQAFVVLFIRNRFQSSVHLRRRSAIFALGKKSKLLINKFKKIEDLKQKGIVIPNNREKIKQQQLKRLASIKEKKQKLFAKLDARKKQNRPKRSDKKAERILASRKKDKKKAAKKAQ